MLIIVVILDQLSYDNFHPNSDRLYRITSNNLVEERGALNLFASSSIQVGEELKGRCPLVENYVTLNRNFTSEAKYKGASISISGYYASAEFFNIMGFPLKGGEVDEVLKEPFSLVLTENEAVRHFGDEDPIGKLLSIDKYGEFKVTGIIPENQFKSHLQFDALVSLSTIDALIQQEVLNKDSYKWESAYSNYSYILVQEGTEPEEIYSYLDQITEDKFSGNDKYKWEYRLQAMGDVVPGPIISNELGTYLPRVFVLFLAGLALVVMISASFNYTSLSIARSLLRAKEVGVRKTMGAKRKQIIWQFLVEAIVIAVISALIGFVILQFLLPGFSGMKLMAMLKIKPGQNITVYLWFLIFAVLTGLVSGMLPAVFISAFNPIKVLKGFNRIKLFGKLTLRKILLSTQFVFSMIFLITIILLFRQFNFMLNADMGINKEFVYNLQLQGQDSDVLKDQLASLPEVKGISLSSHVPGTGNSWGINIRRNMADEELEMNRFDCDYNYVDILGIELVSGENFTAEMNEGKNILISESALPVLQFKTAQEAVGQSVYIWDSTLVEISGVFKNYKYRALFLPSGPLVLRNSQKNCPLLTMSIESANVRESLSKIESIWKKVDPIHEMKAEFLDEEIRENYSYFEDILYTVGFTSVLAILIACLGLLGMATFSTQTKTKEIGVRKVLGAKSVSVISVIMKPYVSLLIISALIAAPLGYFINDLWLQNLANHVHISSFNLMAGVFIILFTAMLTISSQTYKAANLNPTDSLRYE
jgi:putative ABC transport system permease protein